MTCILWCGAGEAFAFGTALGEIEGRPAPVARRMCLAGANAGALCNEDADCPGATCRDRNIVNLSVAVHYDAPAADLATIENMVSAGSDMLFDVTDGQVELGQATIHNNSAGTTRADIRVYPATCTGGTQIGNACNVNNDCADTPGTNDGYCGVWWGAETGSWQNGGSIHVSINKINDAGGNVGRFIGHELSHLIFDVKDEYESRPGCGNNTGNADCPDAASGQTECLMDSNNSEFCWGQGDPTDLTDMTGGNHDATNITEQSECRNDRSCWDQVVWAWPNTILKPAAAPDPAANGAMVDLTKFVTTDDTVRVVLVLDESGSMGLESPSRLERLKVAAKNFVSLAEDGTELGLVSYATNADTASGRAEVAIAPLGVNRSAWNNAIDGLAPSTRTNIGAGLQKARDLITTAGGVTGNTFIVLMSDGLNNEPLPQANAAADLNAKIAMLLTDKIPVYVTCTGSDLGLTSQCSEIGTGTRGHYVDSADPAQLPEAFADFHERIIGHEAVRSVQGDLAKVSPKDPVATAFVEEGSTSASFVLQWANAGTSANMLVRDPLGNSYDTQQMTQGRFLRVADPAPGDWLIYIEPRGAASPFTATAYARNPSNHISVGIRYPSIIPNGDIYLYAYPKDRGRSITSDQPLLATVTRPDGGSDTLELYDRGRDATGRGDDVPGDGVFTGVYKGTGQTGPYQFAVKADIENWVVSADAHEYQQEGLSSRFMREVRLSTAVNDPNVVETSPEDDDVPGVTTRPPCERYLCLILQVILFLLLLLLLLNLWLNYRCGRTRG
ncbi:MAG: VWA domain-containing protein [Desulfuromonadaceae bacterium]